ncbi:MAG: DNA translocase FtsK 4TM domain-containing protein [Albidovulum sp.]|nr:DNA translocase FtsK 4TM domain-containing protein [Albidovulum sp.]MDE0533008.1 DNA translocase FtsK 4TM domain-containing protein [Albidovulum sp.]
MAYHARHREPLIDGQWQQTIEKRVLEILGITLFATGIALAFALGSYTPNDPGLLTVTSEPVRNILGPTGAAIASPLIVTVGLSSWCAVVFLAVWGIRFFFHCNPRIFLNRVMLLPIATAFISVFAATFPIPEFWNHHFGIGGMFGDSIFAAVTYSWPWDPITGNQLIVGTVIALGAASSIAALGISVKDFGTGYRAMRAIGRLLPRPAKRVNQGDAGSARTTSDGSEYASGPNSARTETGSYFGAREEKKAPRKRFLNLFASSPNKQRGGTQITEKSKSPRIGAAEPPLTRTSLPGFDTVAPPQEHARPLEIPDSRVMHPKAKKNRPSRKAKAEQSPELPLGNTTDGYTGPPLVLLQEPDPKFVHSHSEAGLEADSDRLATVLSDYGIKGEIGTIRPGPVVTLYELLPAPGLKASRVIGLSDDIARSMMALSARISTVPGRSAIGIELPNPKRDKVYLREIVSTTEFGDSKMNLPIALGKDIAGDSVIVDLATMPHLLVAGTTGSGKSVAINTMILSLLYRLSPEDCRLIMIDPKMLELSVYDGIPHLLSPVVTDPKKAVVALKWAVGEMEKRYHKMSKLGVRNIGNYNERAKEALSKGEKFSRTVQTGFDEGTGDPVFMTEEFDPDPMPYIVVIVDEMADLMMVAGKEIEGCIQRLAQMARASGIHLVMATQRPSVDVITGTIKANFPTRISFQVTSKVDSRTILGEQGAEQLLGMGDMLYLAGGGRISRVHGPFVSDEEVEAIVAHLKTTGTPQYVSEVVEETADSKSAYGGDSGDAEYDQAVAIVLSERKCSTSYIQRRLKIGYNKAARIVEEMEANGLVGTANHLGKREILVPEGT